MASIPRELEKIKPKIEECMSQYEILEGLNYKFTEEEDIRKKWVVFGGCKETVDLI